MSRINCRFSCGAASAVATKLILSEYPRDQIVITNSRLGGEHEDNDRFRGDCERWFGHPIIVRQSEKYDGHIDVWEKERFIKGPGGTACRQRLKQQPWLGFELPDDTLVIGYTAGEEARLTELRKLVDLPIIAPLIDRGLTKEDCFGILDRAGIALPIMYLLGFHNNNCIGCCRGGKGYWNKIREVFPAVFQRVARLQRELGIGARFWIDGDGNPIMLDELDPKAGHYPTEPDISCSIMCHLAEQDIA